MRATHLLFCRQSMPNIVCTGMYLAGQTGQSMVSVRLAVDADCCSSPLVCCAAAACGKLVTTSAEINVYDISVEAGVALRDLLSLNPVIVPDTSLSPGTQLARPCYVSGAPTYFGADIAQVWLLAGIPAASEVVILRLSAS